MCESHREQRPLLSDDISDEEFKVQSPPLNRRAHSVYSGRARTQAKGAVTVLTNWPGHLSSVLACWWAGLGMIAMTIFMIYNSLAIIDAKSLADSAYRNQDITPKNVSPYYLNLFLHIFVKEKEDLIIDTYLPSIKMLAMTYPKFKYHLMIMTDDLSTDMNQEIDEKKSNYIALNSILTQKWKFDKKQWVENISIQYLSLSNYLDESPLKIFWRDIPQKFIKFLVRCVAIWEKGGVAINPDILNSKLSDSVYRHKLQYILNKFTKYSNYKNTYKEHQIYNVSQKNKTKHQVNNIRDIINNLNEEDSESNIIQDNLTETENKEYKYVSPLNVNKNLQSVLDNYLEPNNRIKKSTVNTNVYNESDIFNPIFFKTFDRDNNSLPEINTSKKSLLTAFLGHLFHNEDKKSKHLNNARTQTSKLNKYNSSLKSEHDEGNINNQFSMVAEKKPSDNSVNKDEYNNDIINNNMDQNFELTVDIRGNLVATKTPCHAFIGNILSNIKHHSDEETITDLVTAELSIFCRGLISTCKGVDVVML